MTEPVREPTPDGKKGKCQNPKDQGASKLVIKGLTSTLSFRKAQPTFLAMYCT